MVRTKLFFSFGRKEVQACSKLAQFQVRGSCQVVSRLMAIGSLSAVTSIM